MENSISRKSANDNYNFKEIKKRFIALNKARYVRTLEVIRPSQKDFLELLPLLYHVNHPILAGYVSSKTPCGIPEYSPTKKSVSIAKRFYKSFVLKKRAYRSYAIQAIYLMGSTGSIAYSIKSDFDIWVCYDSTLDLDQIHELEEKTRAIEEWAKTLGVDASIFLVDPDRVRIGDHDDLSIENSGSALHFLLLEEFYRTSVLLSGRYPIWWLVPPDQEEQYDDIVADIKLKRYLHSKEHIDFGGIGKIPAEEFYGATLWLLYKGIDSPYKSILKIILMEIYADEYPNIDLLSMQYKRKVYQGDVTIDETDPYLMMLEKVEKYLIKKDQHERLELIRRSFYLKVNIRLGSSNKKLENDFKLYKMIYLVNKWQWTSSYVDKLDNQDNWNLRAVSNERREIINDLTTSYRALSDFAREQSETMAKIKPSDLNVLGRKIYAAFERKAGKIEIVYKGITKELYEDHLTISRRLTEDNQEKWTAYHGALVENDLSNHEPLKIAHSLIELCAWCYFNKIFSQQTIIALYSDGSDLSNREIRAIFNHMKHMFEDIVHIGSSFEDYRQASSIRAIGTFINVGLDPFATRTKRGEHLASSRTDSLQYGGLSENLALSIDQVIVTSWQEVLTFRYYGVQGLLDCLREYILWSPPSQGRRPPAINAVSFSSLRGNAIASRVEGVFDNIISCFYDDVRTKNTRFVLGVEKSYFLIKFNNDSFESERVDSIDELLQSLNSALGYYSPVIFDQMTLGDSVLPLLYQHNKPDTIQLFYYVSGKEVTLYILDEKGALFHYKTHFHNAISIVNQYQRFFDSINKRMIFLSNEIGVDYNVKGHEMFQIDKTRTGVWSIHKESINRFANDNEYVSLQVIGDVFNSKPVFSIYVSDKEFTTIEYGKELYSSVIEHVLRYRKSKKLYSVYITDVDISKSLLGNSLRNVQTIHYLNYKKQIEENLNFVLENMINS
ncbi:MAG: class I adenylate cyclase [Gammaproteobacteria bacterium]